MMNDDELLRYSRHILLPDIDIGGQQALQDSHVLIVGLGGLGSPVAMYLAAAGIGSLTLVDFDKVDLSNLQRQVIHTQGTIGTNKAISAKAAIRVLNQQTQVKAIDDRFELDQWIDLIETVDIVVDCTDNFTTRFALNRACYQQKKPLVSGAAIRFEGQLTVYDARTPTSPCYQCLYSPDTDDDLTCSEAGVISPLVGVIGSLQALEVVKLASGAGSSLVGRLILFDAKGHQWRELQLLKDSHCVICSASK
ncbi:molybdopterin-synthase adenylyltransferase MoeB [Candidatus Endobugula sertula]|uniref:Molybdopterin-synthase adenylyltransferase n=1 Tax=Candidatus Endobugula sertula TaxID=62101 RepID=A0A1D2QMW5_9GAMM|nr:molybdopterin-synthase adenylyltransferase MoeB [Candidatus Endobugula sertula]